MKILDVRYNAEIENGGARSHYLLLQELSDRGHEVELLCTEEYPGFTTHIMEDYMSLPFLELRQRLVAREVRKQLKRNDYDYVYTHGRYAMPGTLQAANETGTSSIAHFKDYWFADVNGTFVGDDGVYYERCSFQNVVKHSKTTRIPWNLYKLRYLGTLPPLLDSADVKLATSGLVSERLEEAGVTGAEVVPDPFDLDEYEEASGEKFREEYSVSDDTRIVTFSGTLEKHKGTGLLEKLVPRFDREDVLFVMTGTGSGREELENSLENADTGKYLFTGWIDRPDLLDLYDASTMVIYPSVYPEGFGRVPIEAAASGTPVVMSDRVAVAEYFTHGENAFLLDPGDTGAWEKRIKELLDNKELRDEMAAKAGELSGEFYTGKHVERFLDALEG